MKYLTNLSIFFAFTLLTSTQIQQINSSNILFIYPIATKSETQLFLPFAQALAARGHSLTIVTPVHTKNLSSNIVQIVPTTPLDFSNVSIAGPLEVRAQILNNKYQYMAEYDDTFTIPTCHHIYQHKEFADLYQNGGVGKYKYDLVVMSGWFQNCFDAVLYKLKAPFILFTSMPVTHWMMAITTGYYLPPSFVPIPLLELEDSMSFGERFGNTLMAWLFQSVTRFMVMPQMDAVGRKYLGDGIPDGVEIERNVSMIFSHGHYALTFPRPLLPDTIEIGGIHCRPAQKLPGDIEKFMNEAKDGVILFSLGSVVQAHTLPEETIKIFLNVFSRVKQRVLWKWEKESIEDLPPNVKLSKWLPQQDVLGHPNMKLFISHGGLLSTMESTYHGVPILGIPVFADQDTNMRSIRRLGYSLTIEILELHENEFETKIHQMLNDVSFTERAKEASSFLRNQLSSPMDRAVYWAEYVIKHRGAPYLKSAARQLNFWQYHSADVLLVLGAIITTVLVVILYLIKKLWNCLYCRSSSKSKSEIYKNGSTKKLQ